MAPKLAHFELRERIGLGAMGAVYRADDARLGRTVAVKLLLPEVAEDAERRSRFLREARAAAGLNHPNIAMIFEVGEVRFDGPALAELRLPRHGTPSSGFGDIPFFAMEYVPGQDLGTLLETNRETSGRLEIGQVVDLARQIARALEAAHGAGIVHRDLKPGNVRVTPQGRAKLLDFGLAKLLSRESGRTVDSGTGSQLTLDGMVMGTLPYLAPEQLQGLHIDGRADLFALGVMLYEMLTGRAPYPSDSMVEYARALLVGGVAKPSSQRPDTPQWLDDLVLRLMHTDPDQRPMSAAVVRMELEEHMTSYRDASGTTVTVLTAGPDARPAEAPRRISATLITVLTVLLVIFAGVAIAWRYGDVEPEPTRLVPGPPAVAVVPLSAVGDPPPLALGLVIYLHRNLQLLPGLAVRDLDDAMVYSTVAAGFGAIGRELQADWVLSGQVMDAQPLKLRLVWVRSADGAELWSKEVDLTGDAILDVQSGLLEEILTANPNLLVAPQKQPSTGSRAALRSYFVALARLDGQRPEIAAAAFERSRQDDPEFFWALVDSARCLRLGPCRSARTDGTLSDPLASATPWPDPRSLAEQALAVAPGHPAALFELAHLDADSGRPEAALETLGLLLSAHPSYQPALRLQAESFAALDRFADARKALERALRRDPGSWQLHDRLGRLLADAGELEAAENELAEADRLAPSRMSTARTHRSDVLWRQGLAARIVALQEESPRRVREPALARILGLAHDELGNVDRARELLGLAVELAREDPARWVDLARHYERSGRAAFARASFNEARKIWQSRLRPGDGSPSAEAWSWYVYLEAKRERCDKALEAVDERGLAVEDSEQALLLARALAVCERRHDAERMIGEALQRGLPLDELESDGDLASLDPEDLGD